MSDKGQKFYEQARVAFKKLSPKKGDVLCVSFPADMPMGQVQTTVGYLQQLGNEFECAVIALGQGITMDVMTEQDMNELGWYRDPDLQKRTLQ